MSNLEQKYSVHFETLGCRLNQDESEGAARTFTLNGFISDMEPITAKTQINKDIILAVINTCTVTGKAEQKARRLIRLMLEKYPNAPVIVTGCYAELDSIEITSISPERIIILAGTQKFLLASIAEKLKDSRKTTALELRQFIEENKKFSIILSNQKKSEPYIKSVALNPFTLYTPVFEKHSRASIKIQDGCNCSCTFCRIHLARGKSVSLNVEDVIHRVQELEQKGSKEVVFTGVNLSQYSGVYNGNAEYNFAQLLETLLKETENIAFRISSFYPQSVSDELCKILSSKRIQPFFHLSIQSGSERILSLMKRPHSVDHVIQSIKKIRSVKENPFISCDIIAGFPGETEDDFLRTRELCETQNFAWIHAFPYSPRPGTPAMNMKPQIPDRIKGERVKWLTDIAIKGKIDYIKYWKGRTVSAIVENSRALRIRKDTNPIIHCVTENFLHVECPSAKPVLPGELINIRITDVLEDSILEGKEIECKGIIQVQ